MNEALETLKNAGYSLNEKQNTRAIKLDTAAMDEQIKNFKRNELKLIKIADIIKNYFADVGIEIISFGLDCHEGDQATWGIHTELYIPDTEDYAKFEIYYDVENWENEIIYDCVAGTGTITVEPKNILKTIKKLIAGKEV